MLAPSLELLAIAPDPDRAARLPKSTITAALRRAHRHGVEDKATWIRSVLRAPALRQPGQVQAAFAVIVTSQVRLITTLNSQIAQLGEVVSHHFGSDGDRLHDLRSVLPCEVRSRGRRIRCSGGCCGPAGSPG